MMATRRYVYVCFFVPTLLYLGFFVFVPVNQFLHLQRLISSSAASRSSANSSNCGPYSLQNYSSSAYFDPDSSPNSSPILLKPLGIVIAVGSLFLFVRLPLLQLPRPLIRRKPLSRSWRTLTNAGMTLCGHQFQVLFDIT